MKIERYTNDLKHTHYCSEELFIQGASDQSPAISGDKMYSDIVFNIANIFSWKY